MWKHLIILVCIICLKQQASYSQKNLEDSLQKVIATSTDGAELAKAYNALGYEYTRKDAAKARNYFQAAIDIARPINNFKRLSSTYSMLVYMMHDQGRPDSAEYFISQVKDLYERAVSSEKDMIGSNYYTVAAMYYKRTGAYTQAIPYFEKSIELNKKTNNKESTAGQYLNLGNTYQLLGNYQKATEQHLQSLKLFDELGEQRGVSFCYESLANSFIKLKQYNQALNYAQKSLQIKQKLADKRGLGTGQASLGDVYSAMGEYEKALIYYNKGLALATEIKNMGGQQDCLFAIAKVYAATKNLKQAETYFIRAKELAKQRTDSSSIAAIEMEMLALGSARKTAATEVQLNTSLNLFQKRGDLVRKANGYKNMSDFYTKNKDFEKALVYNNKYYQLTDSIRNTELQLQVLKMEEGYTSAKKESEIQVLKKDQELQKQKLSRQQVFMFGSVALALLALGSIWLLINRNKLKQRMKELELRNRIAADLHDEVGSSLSSIHLLSQMAAQRGEGLVQKNILEKMSVNARETMDKMSDLVWTIKPEEAEGSNLKQRMERFAYEICGAKNIALSLQLDKLDTKDLNMEQRKNMYLIFKEALNNAVKYSGTDKIHISAANGSNILTMIVKDEGKGFDSNIAKIGNGLTNIKNRAKGVGGKVDIESVPGHGTTIKLIMPLNP